MRSERLAKKATVAGSKTPRKRKPTSRVVAAEEAEAAKVAARKAAASSRKKRKSGISRKTISIPLNKNVKETKAARKGKGRKTKGKKTG